MNTEGLVLLAPAIPLVAAALIAGAGRWPNIREAIALVAGGLLLLTVMALLPEVAAGGRPSVALFEMLPGLEI